MAVVEHPWTAADAAQVQIVFQRTVAGKPTQDVAVTKLSFQDEAPPMDAYNPAVPNPDMTAVEEAIGTFWGTVKTYAHTSHALAAFRWYQLYSPWQAAEGPMRVNDQAVPSAGTDSSSLPPQVAVNVTLETDIRKHWGRMCLPLTGNSARATDGRLTVAATDAIATAAQTLFSDIAAATTLRPVVYSRPTGSVADIIGIRVDDTYDIIRRRRYEGVPYRSVLSI